MSHARQAIRDAALTAVTGLATTGARVGSTLEQRLDFEELPAVRVDITEEAVISFELGDVQVREAKMMLRGFATRTAAAPDVSAVLDDIDEETANALFASYAADTLGCDDLRYVAMDKDYDDEGEHFTGTITCEYSLVYRVDQSAPTSAL